MSLQVKVECYAGSSYPQRPRAVEWQGERLIVDRIEAQWRQPEGFGFLVSTTDGQVLELFYFVAQDVWQGKAA